MSCQESPRKQNTPSNEVVKDKILEQGKMISSSSFKSLSSKLKSALEEGGVKNAISYCSLNAQTLTDSLSGVHKVSIKRSSDKYRNIKNKPSAEELSVIQTYQKNKNEELILEPFVDKIEEGYYAFYAPILVNEICLNCHGIIGKSLKEEDYALINELYPEDLANGYQAGDLRGIWSIQFKTENYETRNN